jgi:hypothetical protein
MNLTTTSFSTIATKLQAMGSALVVTLAMLGGINGLATSQPSAALVADVVHVADVAAGEHS